MMEKDWLASDDPQAMLAWATAPAPPGGLRPPRRGWYPSDRKLRLFACAVSRHLEGVFQGAKVAQVEWYCDEPKRFGRALRRLADVEFYWCAADDPLDAAQALAQTVPGMLHGAALLREVVGNPYRPVKLDTSLGRVRQPETTWFDHRLLTPTVLSLAQAAYDERPGRRCGKCFGNPYYDRPCDVCQGTGTIDDGTLDPFRIALVADALEEAGCTDEAILTHLRSPGPHVRGCWALDLILGKE